jgi:hypothetical protein
MQRLPCKRRDLRRGAPAAIRRIADQRVPDGGEMDADLMCSAGFERATHERRVAEALERRHVSACRLAGGDDGHRGARGGVAPDRRVGGNTRQVAADTTIALCNAPKWHQIDCATSVLAPTSRPLCPVETMDDAGAAARPARGMVQER